MKSTAETIKEMEKELIGMQLRTTNCNPEREIVLRKADISKFLRSCSRTLLEAFGEEVIGKDRDEVIGNETYLNTIVENQLRARQRLRVKEIISSISK